MKKIKELLQELEPEARQIAEKTINRVCQLVECEVSWKDFFVYNEYEEIVKAILCKNQAHYIVAACTAVDSLEKKPKRVKIAVATENSDVVEVLKPGKDGSRTVVIPINKMERKFLLQ